MQIVTNYLNDSNTSRNISLEPAEHTVSLTLIILSLFLSCFCIITVLGNALVIYAVLQERYLKSGRKKSQASQASTRHGICLISPRKLSIHLSADSLEKHLD